MKVTKILTHNELAERFIKVNTGVKVLAWQPLIGDDSMAYANTEQPAIRVDIEGGNWLRVYIDKEYNEITWY